MWTCDVCTLNNIDTHLACDACRNARVLPATPSVLPSDAEPGSSGTSLDRARPAKRARAEGEPPAAHSSDSDSDDDVELLPSAPRALPAVAPVATAQPAAAAVAAAARTATSSSLTTTSSASQQQPPRARVYTKLTTSTATRTHSAATTAGVSRAATVKAASLPVTLAAPPAAVAAVAVPSAPGLSSLASSSSSSSSPSSSAAPAAAQSAAATAAAAAAAAAAGARAPSTKAADRLAKASAKAALKADKAVDRLVAKAHRGGFAEQEITVLLHEEFREAKFASLLSSLQESKFSYSFPTLPATASSVSSSAAAASSAAVAASSSSSAASQSSLTVLRRLPRCVMWERQQPPEVVAAVRAHKRARLAPTEQWKTLEEEARLLEAAERQRAVEEERRRAAGGMAPAAVDVVDELPPPSPVLCVVVLLSAAEFLSLYYSDELRPSVQRWITCLNEGTLAAGKRPATLLLLVHGLYASVQLQSSQRRAESSSAKQAGSPLPSAAPRTPVRPLRKLTDVDALLTQIWLESWGRVTCKMLSDEGECLSWLVQLTSLLSKAPYKDADTALTLVNTGRTDRMRGGDEFRMRASPQSDDSDDESSGAVRQRRQAAQSTLAESWRLYLMQIPRMSERIAVCLTRAYATPRHLWDAYRACSTDKQRESLVQDLSVSAAPGAGGRAARIGPALSKALYQAMWQQHADIKLTPANNAVDIEASPEEDMMD